MVRRMLSPNLQGIQLLREKCANLPGIVHPFQIDLSSKESIENAYDFVAERLPPGAGPIGNFLKNFKKIFPKASTA